MKNLSKISIAYLIIVILVFIVNTVFAQVTETVPFELNADTTSWSAPVIADQIDTISVLGFASRSGSEEYNMALSKRRAIHVADKLRSANPESVVVVYYYGELYSCDHEEELDRHVTIFYDVKKRYRNSGGEIIIDGNYTDVESVWSESISEEKKELDTASAVVLTKAVLTAVIEKMNKKVETENVSTLDVKTVLVSNNNSIDECIITNSQESFEEYEIAIKHLKEKGSLNESEWEELISIQERYKVIPEIENKLVQNKEIFESLQPKKKRKKRRRARNSSRRGLSWKVFRKWRRKNWIRFRTWLNPHWNC